jgi:phosphomannomutase
MDFLKNNPPRRLLSSKLAAVKSYDGIKFVAEDGSWLMLRGSGTEPILRIYAETKTKADAETLLKHGMDFTERYLRG